MGRYSETLTTFWWGIRYPTFSPAVKTEQRWITVRRNSPCLKETSHPVTPTETVNTVIAVHKRFSGWKYINYQLIYSPDKYSQLLLPTKTLCSLAKEPNILIPIPQPSGKSKCSVPGRTKHLLSCCSSFACIFHTIFWNRREAQNTVTYNPEEQ